jgi:hypothetical protein
MSHTLYNVTAEELIDILDGLPPRHRVPVTVATIDAALLADYRDHVLANARKRAASSGGKE